MIQRAAVIGAGTMGPGIAQTMAQAGITTCVVDIDAQALARGHQRVNESLDRFQAAGFLTEGQAEQARASLSFSTDLAAALREVDLVVEAVPEAVPVKAPVLKAVAALAPEHAILTSNTSALPMHQLFPDLRPDRFVITHYFNPPEIMPLIEVVCGPATDPSVVTELRELAKRTGKTAVVLRRYLPGFLVNRLQAAMLREVLYLWEQDLASAEDIDEAVRASTGFRSMAVGPFATVDLSGLDTIQAALSVINPLLCNAGEASARLRELVAAGHLGVKTGRGMSDYVEGRGEQLVRRRDERLLTVLKAWQEMAKGEHEHGC